MQLLLLLLLLCRGRWLQAQCRRHLLLLLLLLQQLLCPETQQQVRHRCHPLWLLLLCVSRWQQARYRCHLMLLLSQQLLLGHETQQHVRRPKWYGLQGLIIINTLGGSVTCCD
jgi:hypothetical protein